MTARAAPATWWHPEPVEAAAEAEAPFGRFAFGALIAFTAILIASPQAWLPQLAPLRLALLAAAAAIASNLVHRAWTNQRSPTHPTVVIAFALVAWATLTIPLSAWPGGSVETLTEHFLKAVAYFWLIATLVTSLARLRMFVWVLVACGWVLALSAIANYRSGVFLEGSIAAMQRIAGYGGSGLATNPNDLALMMNLLIPFAAVLALIERGALRKAAAGLAFAAFVVAVVLTFSRAGFLALAAMGIFAAVAAIGRRPLLTIATVGLLAVSTPILPDAYRERLTTITNISADPTGSAQGRWKDLGVAAQLAWRHPVVGVGLGQNMLALNSERGTTWREVHNVYLQLAVDLGWPGLALFLCLFVTLFRAARRASRRALGLAALQDVGRLAGAVQAAFVAFAIAALFHPIAYQFYFFFIAGLAVAVDNVSRTMTEPTVESAAAAP